MLREAGEKGIVLGMISNHLAFWFHPEPWRNGLFSHVFTNLSGLAFSCTSYNDRHVSVNLALRSVVRCYATSSSLSSYSSAPRPEIYGIHAFLAHVFLSQAFKSLCATAAKATEVCCSKPTPRIYELFLERLGKRHGLKAFDCVFVDDKLENVRAAEALGLRGLHFDARQAAPGELRKALRAKGLPL